jgi:DNA adenine methylase
MKPIIKYQGGKSKELPIIRKYISKEHSRIVEPFCGGAAVTFGMEIPGVLNDTNKLVINLYKSVAYYDHYCEMQEIVNWLKKQEHDELEKQYYSSRDLINNPEGHNEFYLAMSYLIVRQLCFSGMERYNSKGEFNVPFGHYKKFSCNLSLEHHLFLKECDITCRDAISVFDTVEEGDFVFIDPPYLDRLGYTTGDGGMGLHVNLSKAVAQCSADWLIVHCDDPFYQDAYSEYNIQSQDFNYSQRWGKNKDHSKSKVNHLYISNVPVNDPALAPAANPLFEHMI